jgi:two-component system response regulator AtoC
MLSLVLRKAGYQIKAVDNGEEALKELMLGGWDMVLSDIRMPQMDGHRLLQEIQDRGLETTVIMMSAYGDRETALEAIQKGAYDYISKPFKKDDVLLTLRKAEERESLRRENRILRQQTSERPSGLDSIIARSQAMEVVFRTVRKVAQYKTTVLLSGESGTGKELIARAIHDLSDRAKKSWVAVNCGAIPESLLESELFGYVRGAFTDANRDKPGLFQQADGGTLFLDEIGEMPLNLQVKLLRVLQESEVRRVGDTRSTKIDVRVVAATHQDISEMIAGGTFREDLYYRLAVMPIKLPSLRERREDIPLLVNHFIESQNLKLGTHIQGVEPPALKAMMEHAWPGNVRELENTIERAMVLSDGDRITFDALPEALTRPRDPLQRLFQRDDLSIKKASRELERVLIQRALEKTGGNRTRASELLEISHRALLYKIKDYGLT